MTCANCPSPATVHVTYGSSSLEPAEVDLCADCSFGLHQEMLGHLLHLGGFIEESPLDASQQKTAEPEPKSSAR